MVKYCYLNAKIIPIEKAGVSLDDIGLLRGFGIFEFLRTYNGIPFLFKEHMARLKNSANLLGLKVPLSPKKIAEAIKALIQKNRLKEANIRIVLTGGKTINGIEPDYKNPTFFILLEELKELPSFLYSRGVKLITCEYQREAAGAKTLNYLTAVRLQNLRKKKGAFEILYTSDNLILECSTSNFFIFRGDTLVTPRDNILIGTTRNLVVKLAKPKFKVVEKDIRMEELNMIDEAFITATNKEILPVVKIDNKKIGTGKVGEKTKCLMELFREYTKILTNRKD